MTGDDPRQWRQRERARLLAARLAVPAAEREAWTAHIAAALPPLLRQRKAGILGFYWPVRGEVDLRPLTPMLIAAGWRLSLPVIADPAGPLEYRAWVPGEVLGPGRYGIPEPRAGAPLQPDILLAPLVGFDAGNYRLGYGKGFFDRTLAALAPRPLAIGIGFELAFLASVFPHAHDIPMDFILTETALRPKPAR
jgi:5-formyltetrahydrofolate cyclo-ligase